MQSQIHGDNYFCFIINGIEVKYSVKIVCNHYAVPPPREVCAIFSGRRHFLCLYGTVFQTNSIKSFALKLGSSCSLSLKISRAHSLTAWRSYVLMICCQEVRCDRICSSVRFNFIRHTSRKLTCVFIASTAGATTGQPQSRWCGNWCCVTCLHSRV